MCSREFCDDFSIEDQPTCCYDEYYGRYPGKNGRYGHKDWHGHKHWKGGKWDKEGMWGKEGKWGKA